MPEQAPAQPQRHGYHLRPFAGAYRHGLLARFMPVLWPQVEKWAATAAPIASEHWDATGKEYTRVNLGAVLFALDEWDGFIVCKALTQYGWACDAELVGIIHCWSCKARRALADDRKKQG